MPIGSVAVFAGPSLPPADRVAIAGVQYFAPARRGDVETAASHYPNVLLVDGIFQDELSTSPKEMLRACRRTKVFGAASMGALRAAECRAFGAVPLGAIATWYANGTLEGDDEVAVAMHPQTFAALTVPAVNVRFVAWLARRRGILDAARAAAWVMNARTQIFFADRSWRAVLDLAPLEAREALSHIAHHEGDLKRMDARFALKRLQRIAEGAVRCA